MSASKSQDRHSYLHQDPFNTKTDWTCPLKQLKKDKKILIKVENKGFLVFYLALSKYLGDKCLFLLNFVSLDFVAILLVEEE